MCPLVIKLPLLNTVVKAVAEGLNVIDTAPNYRGGRAEAAVGSALHSLRMTSGAEREMLFVSTKAGYAAGWLQWEGALALDMILATQTPPASKAQVRLSRRRLGRASHAEQLLSRLQQEGAVSADDIADGRHCIHPAAIRASLEASLAALGLESVDIMYIHNAAEAQLRTLGLTPFLRRLRGAFEACEAERREGRVRAYGLATWTAFRLPPDSPDHLSLSAVLELAKAVGGEDHGFRYVQLPINAHMAEAWAEAWQQVEVRGEKGDARVKYVSLLDAAKMVRG